MKIKILIPYILILTIMSIKMIDSISTPSKLTTILPPIAPTVNGSMVAVCVGGFSIYSNNITVCNKDANGKSRQASEVKQVFY